MRVLGLEQNGVQTVSNGSFTFVRRSWHYKIGNKSTDLYSIVSYFSLWGLGTFFGWLTQKSYPMVTGLV